MKIGDFEIKAYVDPSDDDMILLNIEGMVEDTHEWIIVPLSVSQAVLLQRALGDPIFEIRQRRIMEDEGGL